MAYIIHYSDESNPNVIKEEVVLFDGKTKPDAEDIEGYRSPGYDKVEVHDMEMEWFPGSLPTDRALAEVGIAF